MNGRWLDLHEYSMMFGISTSSQQFSLFFSFSASNALTGEGLNQAMEWLSGKLLLILNINTWCGHNCYALPHPYRANCCIERTVMICSTMQKYFTSVHALLAALTNEQHTLFLWFIIHLKIFPQYFHLSTMYMCRYRNVKNFHIKNICVKTLCSKFSCPTKI